MKNLILTIALLSVFSAHAEDQCLVTTFPAVEETSSNIFDLSQFTAPETCEGISPSEVSLSKQTKEEYCKSSSKDLMKRLCLEKGKLGHSNEGGLFGLSTGVCWWNTQFHRKVTYLTYCDPTKSSNYSDQETEEIIKSIHRFNVTPINGYDSFYSFIRDEKYPNRKKILQKFLQKQMGKASVTFEWLNGVQRRSNKKQRSERFIQKQVDEIEDMMKTIKPMSNANGFPSYGIMQVPGLAAHSMLIYDLKKVRDNDGRVYYKMKTHDPSFQDHHQFVGVNSYTFDVESGRWYDDRNFQKLQSIRSQNRNPTIYTDSFMGWMPTETVEAMKQPNAVGAEDWSIWSYKERDQDKIGKAFKEVCGKDLFEN